MDNSESTKIAREGPPYTLTIERGKAGLWYVTASMHKGLLVVGRTMGEALSRVEGVWADLRRAEQEDRDHAGQ